jgi:GH24 family phage-related lysozyme (muramidase)
MPRIKTVSDILETDEILPLADAAIKLGKKFSVSSMRRRINAGEWKEGQHWINYASTDGKNRSIGVNISYIRRHYSIPSYSR